MYPDTLGWDSGEGNQALRYLARVARAVAPLPDPETKWPVPWMYVAKIHRWKYSYRNSTYSHSFGDQTKFPMD